MYVEVLIPLNLSNSFTYKYNKPCDKPYDKQYDKSDESDHSDKSSELELKLGSFVKVNFRGKVIVGIVAKITEDSRDISYKVKEVESLINIKPVSKIYIDFLIWVSEYNLVPIGIVLKSGLINELESQRYFKLNASNPLNNSKYFTKKKTSYQKLLDLFKLKPIVSTYDLMIANVRKATLDKMLEENIISSCLPEAEKDFDNYRSDLEKTELVKILLSEEQNAIVDRMNLIGFYIYLLDGVTGSGKTSIYLNAIIETLNSDPSSQALIMLPEISLSRYILSRIKSHFTENTVVEWHSRVSPNKRIINWHKIINGDARVIVSARSGIFLPIPNLKIIVVDEEHDSSFKQDQGHFIYNARDLAIVRSKMLNIPVILSSATPSLESIYNAECGKYIHLQLMKRFGGAEMPEISIVDMRKAAKVSKYISNELYLKLKENIQRNLQSLIFLNRRGYSVLLLCSECGSRLKCKNCSTWMVQHRRKKILLCHLCGFEMQIPKSCQACKSEKLISFGPGVEKIEEEIKNLFSEQKVLVVSSDNQKAEDFQLIEENKVNIIIGTQIISKGYDFANLSLLAIIDSDTSVHGGDLRSSEKNFQVLQQVIGRVGRRKEIKGSVILQTYSPDSFIIQSLKNYDRDLFYKNELGSRKGEFMPPFSKLVGIIISGSALDDVLSTINDMQRAIVREPNITILGPAPAPIELLNNRHRYRFLVIYKKNFKVQNYIKKWLNFAHPKKKIDIVIDIDPINFL